MGAVVSQACMSTQLHQQQVAIPTQVDTLSPMYPPVDLNAQTESNHDTGTNRGNDSSCPSLVFEKMYMTF